jgi:hypothetical protein
MLPIMTLRLVTLWDVGTLLPARWTQAVPSESFRCFLVSVTRTFDISRFSDQRFSRKCWWTAAQHSLIVLIWQANCKLSAYCMQTWRTLNELMTSAITGATNVTAQINGGPMQILDIGHDHNLTTMTSHSDLMCWRSAGYTSDSITGQSHQR